MQAEEKYRTCVEALQDYAQNAGFSDVVIGLSGGIDSSVVAVMCADAFGADHVHGVLLPGPYSSEHSFDDAMELASNLGVSTDVVSICEPFEDFEQVLGRACGGELTGLAAENTQARCRMVCLMALSNAHGWMLVNTGNKSEACMGYSTLYGDTAGAFAPLGGLYKTDVYAVGRWRNEHECGEGAAASKSAAGADAGARTGAQGARVGIQSARGPIPERVFTKPPSAELSPDQEDEKSLGVDYAALDRVLVAQVERGLSPAAAAAAAGVDEATAERIAKTTAFYAFKRAQEPPFPQTKFYE